MIFVDFYEVSIPTAGKEGHDCLVCYFICFGVNQVACALEADDIRDPLGRRILAVALQEVSPVDGRRFNFDEDLLFRIVLRHITSGYAQGIRPNIGIVLNELHGLGNIMSHSQLGRRKLSTRDSQELSGYHLYY